MVLGTVPTHVLKSRPAFPNLLQRCIDWNRDILKKELELTEEDIIDLPTLFKLDKQGKAVPYFPNMVSSVPVPWILPKNQLIQLERVPRVAPKKQSLQLPQKRKYLQIRPGQPQLCSFMLLAVGLNCIILR